MPEVLEQLQAALGDRYTVEREIGRGGMAVVYLAQDLRHKRQVALKVLRPELAASLGGERFLREIELAAQLTHPNILPLHDSGDAGGLLYYVMPFVDGESVRGRLARMPSGSCATWRTRCPTRTDAAWCTATSSPTTCCWPSGMPW
jgi:serine/threonine-protein kinase